MAKKKYVSPTFMVIPLAGPIGPNIGSGNDAELQPELSPDESDQLENDGGW